MAPRTKEIGHVTRRAAPVSDFRMQRAKHPRTKEIGHVARRAVPVSDFRMQNYKIFLRLAKKVVLFCYYIILFSQFISFIFGMIFLMKEIESCAGWSTYDNRFF